MSGGEHVDPTRSDVKLTYDDFVLFPDDGKRHELIDGEHYVTPSPNTRHQRISRRLLVMIAGWLEQHPIGEVFDAPFDVVFSYYDVVEPDLLYLSNERAAEALTSQHVKGVPELVIEIASPGTRKRDETIKRRLYERFGVTEYWVVDPEVDVVRVYRRSGDRFQRASSSRTKAATCCRRNCCRASSSHWSESSENRSRARLMSPTLRNFHQHAERESRCGAKASDVVLASSDSAEPRRICVPLRRAARNAKEIAAPRVGMTLAVLLLE